MALTGHALIGCGRLLPCLFSRVLPARARAWLLRVHVCVVWRDGTPPRWDGLAILVLLQQMLHSASVPSHAGDAVFRSLTLSETET